MALNEINYIDDFSLKKSVIHSLNPLSKLITTVIFILIITSYKGYKPIMLLPWVIYPIVLNILAEVPFKAVLKRLFIILPIIIVIGIGNIFFNQNTVSVMGIRISLGFLAFLTFCIKSLLVVWIAYIFVLTTGIYNLAYALIGLRVPEIFIWILILLYRYIFIILYELDTILKAYQLLAPKEKGVNIKAWGSMLGGLFFRSLERGKKLYASMYLRGFGNKKIKAMKGLAVVDYSFIVASLVLFGVIKGLIK